MKASDIAHLRLYNQHIQRSSHKKPVEAVSHLGAVQAQDFLGSLWAVGLRLKNATESSVEKAFAEGSILRTHVMRPTWHYVTQQDIGWMLALTAPRISTAMSYYNRVIGLDDNVFNKSEKVITKALIGKKYLTRQELSQSLKEGGIDATGQRLGHIMMQAEIDGVICSGPRRGKQFTYALFSERAPKAKVLDRDEALAQITLRYFTGHGPATMADMMWWSGLTAAEIRNGLSMVKSKLLQETIEGKTYFMSNPIKPVNKRSPQVYLLPPFDEYIVGYKNRGAVLEEVHKQKVNPGSNGMFSPIIVIDGQVVGTWKRTFKKGGVIVSFHPFISFTRKELQAIKAAASRYADFLQLPLFF